jgi:hypothetical protein
MRGAAHTHTGRERRRGEEARTVCTARAAALSFVFSCILQLEMYTTLLMSYAFAAVSRPHLFSNVQLLRVKYHHKTVS